MRMRIVLTLTILGAIGGWTAAQEEGKSPDPRKEEIVNKLNETIHAALADPKVIARLATLGVEPLPLTPEGFAKFIAAESDKWTPVIKSAGIKAE